MVNTLFLYILNVLHISLPLLPIEHISVRLPVVPAVCGADTINLTPIIQKITGVLTAIGAAVCGLGIAVGGIMRATSFGNERRVSDSNTAITCAVVGLITVLLAQGIGTWLGGLACSSFTPFILPKLIAWVGV